MIYDHVIKYMFFETVYERNGKKLFGHSVEILIK